MALGVAAKFWENFRAWNLVGQGEGEYICGMSIKQFLIKILEYLRHKKSYSQDGEDVVVDAFYEGKKGYKGFFVDVGAHHPVRFSNTWMFYRRGWKGINIDPTPGCMKAFNILRSRDTNLEIGVGGEKSTLKFYCFNDAALNTFDEGLANQRNTGKPYKIIKTIDIPILPLRSIFEQHLSKNQAIDFMSVDVEGLDLVVLQSNDWNLYRPKFLMVEDTGFNPEAPLNSEIFNYLKSQNYKIVASVKRTIVYQSMI
jgi:FkbM family methyltransferase